MFLRIEYFRTERPNIPMCVRSVGIENEDRFDDPMLGEKGDRLASALVAAFWKYDPPPDTRRACADVVQKTHWVPYFARNASATAGCTRLVKSPPKRATSRTRLALMYVVSRDGTM